MKTYTNIWLLIKLEISGQGIERVLTKASAVLSYQPEADDAKLMPVRMAFPCALGAKYGSGNG